MNGQNKIVVRGGQVYDHDGDVHKPKVVDILIQGSDIVEVGPNLDAGGAEIVDARNRLVVPGLINAHYHSHDTLCRGMFEELPLEFWLLYTLPMGANRSKEELRARTLVGALESIHCGITCVQDMLGLVPLDEASSDVVVDAYREIGLRVVFSPMVWDVPPIAMVRHKDSLPPDVQEMLGTTGRPIKDQLDYLEHQFTPPRQLRHAALGGGAVCPATLHAQNAAGLRRPVPQARPAGLYPRLRDARPTADRPRAVCRPRRLADHLSGA